MAELTFRSRERDSSTGRQALNEKAEKAPDKGGNNQQSYCGDRQGDNLDRAF
jgi:hypothetical protein